MKRRRKMELISVVVALVTIAVLSLELAPYFPCLLLVFGCTCLRWVATQLCFSMLQRKLSRDYLATSERWSPMPFLFNIQYAKSWNFFIFVLFYCVRVFSTDNKVLGLWRFLFLLCSFVAIVQRIISCIFILIPYFLILFIRSFYLCLWTGCSVIG